MTIKKLVAGKVYFDMISELATGEKSIMDDILNYCKSDVRAIEHLFCE